MDKILAIIKGIMLSDSNVQEKRYRLESFLIKVLAWARDNLESAPVDLENSMAHGKELGKYLDNLEGAPDESIDFALRENLIKARQIYMIIRMEQNADFSKEDWSRFYSDWEELSLEGKKAFIPK